MQMDVVVLGLMRSGTTLVSDLLTVPSRSLIFDEPMLFSVWNDQRARDIHAVAKASGLRVGSEPPRRRDYEEMAVYFERGLAPELSKLDLWGVKEVHLNTWHRLLDRYRPKRLILCVRDLRDVALSALDLIRGSHLAFPGGQRTRDEAWVVSRLAFDVHQLLTLRSFPHLLLRYEDLTRDKELRDRLAAYVGLEALGGGALNRETSTGASRVKEIERHGLDISTRSVGRHRSEPEGPARALATHIWQSLPEYSEAFGYPRPSPKQVSLQRWTGAGDGKDPLHWDEVEDWRGTGPTTFDPFFARRRARQEVASLVEPGSRVMDVGCTLPVLRGLLPEGCKYVGVDEEAVPPRIAAAPWRQGQLPEPISVSLITVVGALEYVEDPGAFFGVLQVAGLPVLLTYHASEDSKDLVRARYGWRNSLSRGDLLQAFASFGFEVEARWAFDGRQSLFRLTPSA